MSADPSDSQASPSSLIEMVKRDLSQQWEQGRQVNVEAYLEALPELGTPETISIDLILAEYEARVRSGAMADAAQFEARFPNQAKVLRQLIDQQAQGSASGSVLGQIGKMIAKPQPPPPPVLSHGKTPIKLPRRFGRYRILKRLGQGAMGAVYLVHDTELHRRVALKVPHFRLDEGAAPADRHDLDRFYREARAAASLDHPNLCPVYDVGQLDGIPYIIMAYIKGRPLSRYIDRNRPMSQRRVAAMVRKLALALEEAHSHGVVHRDLKPSNVMVSSRRNLIIMDFGLAWRIGLQDQRLTRVGLVLGTPAYMPPEQVSGKVEALGPRCDIYSLGVIMYELLTGRVPFEGPETFVLGHILFVEPAPPSRHRPDLDPLIEAICLKAMAKVPEDRYATMNEFATALADYLRSGSVSRRPGSAGSPLADVPEFVDAGTEEVGAERVDESSLSFKEAPESEPKTVELPAALPETATLWQAWHQWMAIIDHFARRRPRHLVNRNAYDKLYNALVQTCRLQAARGDEPTQELYQRLADLVTPWLTPKTLEREDREILFSLLSHCREAEQELRDRTQLFLEPGEQSKTSVRWKLAAVGISVTAVVVAVLLWTWFAA
ncbi:MAG: serine/threonine-protein kinase [Isosphaeraceae bacterium]